MEEGPPHTPDAAPNTTAGDDAAFLFQFLATHDVFCPLCNYNLRHLTEPRCPECGREIRLTVGMSEPYLLPWIFTTIFVAMAASVGVLFIVGMAVNGFPGDIFEGMPGIVCAGISYGSLAIPLTVALIAGRRAFWKWNPTAQVVVAIAALAINISLLLAGFLLVR